jgi:single-stranded-DNA-specific exonuclease
MPPIHRPWLEPQPSLIPSEFIDELNQNFGETTHPLLAELLVQRGFLTIDQALNFIDPERYQPCSAFDLPGMREAVSRIKLAINNQETICVWGDFDVDGQTSTAVLVEALRSLGANPQYYIPQRSTESHGVHIPSLSKIIDSGAALIITCDTGISANEPITYAASRGVDFVVTDHHDLPEVLPAAHCLINPHFLPASHPLSTLPGVGVAYKLVEALFSLYQQSENAEVFLDLAALGIIADVAVLKGDTRYLAQRGLSALRNTKRKGLQALIALAELNPLNLSEEQIGFAIAPRLNALGRLSDANRAIEFFTTADQSRAYLLAIELEGLNAERQLLGEQVFQSAQAQIQQEPSLLDYNILVIGSPTWPAGLIGIVASRLVEQYGKPVLLLSTPPGEICRGSARSIQGVNIIEAIRTQSALLKSFGGHKMAAGVSMEYEAISVLRNGLSKAISEQVGGVLPTLPIHIDAFIELNELNSKVIESIALLAPFGLGNPQVTLAAKNLQIESRRIIGRASEHLLLTVADLHGNTAEVVWWQAAQYPPPGERFDLAFSVRNSDYKGKTSLQLTWIAARDLEPARADPDDPSVIEWIDKRSSQMTMTDCARLLAEFPESQVWIEGGNSFPEIKKGHHRNQLRPSSTLIIGTIPPTRMVIRQAIQQVKPKRIIVTNLDPNLDEVDLLARRLSGLLKYAISTYEGNADLELLAALCAHKVQTIQHCLDWLHATQVFEVNYHEDQNITVRVANRPISTDPNISSAKLTLYKLQAALAETKAFRTYFSNAPIESLG